MGAAQIDKLDLELRHVEESKLGKLATIIDHAKGWRELLGTLNFSWEAVNVIEKQTDYPDRSPTLVLLRHWSITGRKRPTIRALLHHLSVCNLLRAADFVRREILGVQSPVAPELDERQSISTAGTNNTNGYTVEPEFRFENLDGLQDHLEGAIKRYSFETIYRRTNRFCHQPYDPNTGQGTRIGDGRFSSVFRVPYDCEQIIAAKLLKSEYSKEFLANEINLAAKLKHENVLELLGISVNNNSSSINYVCLICPYIENGSLQSCLSHGLTCRDKTYLSDADRLRIALGTARGIHYLHTYKDGPIIHRDIKTANILIDHNLNPKIGDFTLVRSLDPERLKDGIQQTMNVIGTCVYMPPEAFFGHISSKFDVYSFGIVVLELLTGMPPYDERMQDDLFTYISERLSDLSDETALTTTTAVTSTESKLNSESYARALFLRQILDNKAGQWEFEKAMRLFELSLGATKKIQYRPEIGEILSELTSIL